MIKLSILICTISKRRDFFDRLIGQIAKQETDETEVIWDASPYDSIGEKRNRLLQAALGEYVCFIDDDDRISDNYVSLLMDGINKGIDCCSLTGIITEDGLNPKTFIHSIKYDSWFEKDGIYYRNTNHLNAVKGSIAKQMKFPETNHGEDRSYSQQLLESGLLKTEHYIEDVIYYYDYISKK